MSVSGNRLKSLSLSLPLLLFPAMFTAAFVVIILLAPLLSYCYPAFDNMLVSTLATQFSGQELKRSTALSLCETFGLAWLYVSDENAKPLTEFAPISPGLASAANRSRKVDYHDRSYYESVAKIEDGRYLHAGLTLGGALSARGKATLSNPLLWVVMPVRGGTLIAILLFATALLEILIWIFLTRPIETLKDGISDMTKAGSIDLASYDAVKLPPVVLTEVKDLKASMRAIFVYLEKLKQDVINEQERLTRWKKQKAEQEAMASAPESVVLSVDAAGEKDSLSKLQEAKGSSVLYAGDVAARVLRSFPELVDGVLFVREASDHKHASAIVASAGVRSEQKDRFERTDLGQILSQSRLTGRLVDHGPMSLKKFGLEALLADSNSRHIVVAPFVHKRNALGYLLVLAPQPLVQSVLAHLERVCNQGAGIYFGLLLSEEAEEQKWTEPLTGLRNKAYLSEMLGHLGVSLKDGSNPQCCIASFCLSLDPALTQQSESIEAALLEKTAPILRQAVDSGKRKVLHESLPPELEFEIVKSKGLEFVLIATGADRKAYQSLAQIIANLLEPVLTLVSPPAKFCLGVSLYPGAGDSAEELLTRSRAAMYFAEEHGPAPIALLKSEAVPADFRPSRRVSAMKGVLGVLDCTELLQSIASGTRTGMLVVDDGFGREFALTLNNGKLVSATLGKFSGQDAVVELVVTFTAGTFNFTESAVESMELDPARKSLPPLMMMLMESALAEDYYAAARGVLKSSDRMVAIGPNIGQWMNFVDRNDVTERELSIMQSLLNMLRQEGSLILDKMFVRLDTCPTHLKWRSAALLHSYGAIALV